ncbi:MAG: hypothetical protein LC754_15375 [Acidobacteria bacterium]|nr:hypothetical protein [Acidobacteriota bacterium]
MRRFNYIESVKLFFFLSALCAVLALNLNGAGFAAGSDEAKPARTSEKSFSTIARSPLEPVAAHSRRTQAPSAGASQARANEPQAEGCISCHGQTEPMHRTRDGKLKDDGTDAQNLTCTSCHGGNPFARIDGAAGTASIRAPILSAPTHCSPQRAASSSASSTPATCASQT